MDCSNILGPLWPPPDGFWKSNCPQLTPCFLKTVLVWIPCGLLFVFFLFYFCSNKVKAKENKRKEKCKLCICKLVCVCCLILVAVVRFIGTIATELQGYGYVDKLEILSAALFCECMIILALVTLRDCQQNLPRQGNLQFISLALFFTFGIPELLYKFNFVCSGFNQSTLFDDVTYICQFVLFCIGLILFSISHKPHDRGLRIETNEWPEEWASLPSRIFLIYVWRLLVQGYKRTLAITELWEIQDTPESATKAYEAFIQKYNSRKSKSLSLTLILIHWQLLLIPVVLAVCKSILAFVTVFGIRWLIAFTADQQEPRWHGFVYVGIISVSQFLRVICWRRHDLIMMKIGIRIRAALATAVFRKSLCLSPSACRQFGSGEIMNLTSVDAGQILQNLGFCSPLLTAPIQLCLGIYLFYDLVGNACWAGIGVIAAVSLYNLVTGRFSQKYLAKQLQHKDKRLRLLSDMLKCIKSIKLYAWEPAVQKMVNRIREFELKNLKNSFGCYCCYEIFYTALVYIFCIAIFATYTLGFGNLLTAEIAFSSIVLLEAVFEDVFWLPLATSAVLSILVSMKRLNNFFSAEDLIDYVDRRPFEAGHIGSSLSITNGQFKWSLSDEPILDNINLNAHEGKLLAVIGQVGAGKSALLSAVVGDMYITSGNVIVRGRVAYVPQQAWILNATLRENVLFGSQYNKERYESIVAACELEADLAILPAGDFTEIGERGVTLSGGQKQRVSLARAVYQDCDIYLLDDPLSAVDVHVQKELLQKIIGPNGLLKHKTRILVTHAHYCLPHCDEIIILNNGLITDVGDYESIVSRHPHLRAEFNIKYDKQVELKAEQDSSDATSEKPNSNQKIYRANALTYGKLTEDETSDLGKISWACFWLYFKSSGFAFLGFCIFLFIAFSGDVFFFIWLQEWTDSTANVTAQQNHSGTISSNEGISVLSIITVVKIAVAACYAFCFLAYLIKASRVLHSKMLFQVLRAPARFFDTNPAGRVLNRFSKDMDAVDNVIPKSFFQVIAILAVVTFRLIISLYATPIFGFVVFGAIVAFFILQRFYANSSRQFQRLEAISRSPIYSCAYESLQGADNIRIFGKQKDFYQKFDDLMDTNTRVKLTMLTASKWLDIQLSISSTLLIAAAALLCVLTPDLTPGLVGMSIAAIASTTELLRWGFMVLDMLEREMVAMERIKEYLNLESEAPWQSETLPAAQKKRSPKILKSKSLMFKNEHDNEAIPLIDANTDDVDVNQQPLVKWPSAGQIKFVGYSAKYRKDLSLALQNINLTISGGEKVGIVGRTGAGKSSLTLALCRFLEASEGKIYIDNVDISQLGLHELRGKITVIPQDPALFTGTLRQNIDPFETFPDDDVWSALEQSHIKDYVSTLPSGLQHSIEEEGTNLSVGQRQLICLARAILRRSKILILDEPTASVDTQTDELIQTTIRQQFSDCTVITVAHRLETVMDYDSVVVLADGRVVEHGRIQDLLSSDTSEFRKMVAKGGLIQ